jgi:site-specific DNA-cytosine methylase
MEYMRILERLKQVAVFMENLKGILSSMLQHGEGIIEAGVDGRLTDDSDDSTHGSLTP